MSTVASSINREFIDRGIRTVIVDSGGNGDLRNVAYGSLTSLSRDFRRINGMLLLVQVSEMDRAVLSWTGIDRFIAISGTVTEVVRRQLPAPLAPPAAPAAA